MVELRKRKTPLQLRPQHQRRSARQRRPKRTESLSLSPNLLRQSRLLHLHLLLKLLLKLLLSQRPKLLLVYPNPATKSTSKGSAVKSRQTTVARLRSRHWSRKAKKALCSSRTPKQALLDVGTTQVCLFRDSYEPLTAAGLSIYGLSTDSPKANTTFKDKQKLPYPLLCNPSASLIGAIGLEKAPKGTTRGVFVVKKNGEVLAAEPGGPAATLDVVKAVVEKMGGSGVGEKAEARAAQAEKEESKDGEAAKL
ncbi:unnamed protein product [Aureobasidium pullulans]|nr:unnamed protein product [Aureobasidium pullulans]